MLPRLSRRADRFRALAVLTALLPAAAMAQATEEVVTLSSQGQDVVGTLQLPDGEAAPVVLLLHGFTGSRDELVTEAVPDGVFGHAANLLADAGYASLRIDFRGSGDSVADMNFAQTTFETQVADGLAALDWLAQAPQVDADRLFVIGWSQGGLVATAVVGRSGETVDAAALWAAASMPVETFTGLLGDAAMAEGAAAAPDAPVTVTLPWGAEIDLNGAYFAGLTSFDAAAEIAGTTNIVEEIPTFVSTSRVVPAVLGIGFGVISQAKPTDVPVTMVITHPPMGDGGVTRESYDAIISAGADSLTMFTFEYEYELVAGPWAITAMTGEDVLFRAEFTVAPPQQVPALAGICGYENLLS